MYKKQMIFQKVICYVMLVASALVFVYSLGLSTDLYDALNSTMMDPSDYDMTDVQGSRIYYDIQPFNKALTMVSIGLIIANLILFITCTHSRRKYYIGNFFSIGLSTVCNVGASVWAISNLMAYKQTYLQIDFEALKAHADLWKTLYTDSTFWFDISFFVFGLLLLTTVLLLVNLALKVIMMKEERRLIGSRKDVVGR